MIGLAIAFAVSLALTPVARALGHRFGLVDHPKARSSHAVPTARSGGMAIAASIVTALIWINDPGITALAGLAVLLAVLGIMDDKLDLSARTKLIVQIVVALLALALPALRVEPWLAAVALVWIVGVTNGFNFMDGVNGIASLEAVVCGAAMGVFFVRAGDAPAAALAFAIAGAAAGFFPWNAFTRIFMGDVGSLPLGFLLASLVVRGMHDGIRPWLMAAPLVPFLLDTSITLARRSLRREEIWKAHRTHFYQQLTDLGWSHLAVAFTWAAFGALAAAAALYAPLWALASVVLLNLAVLAVIEVSKKN